jgi:uncharacterized membrane protein
MANTATGVNISDQIRARSYGLFRWPMIAIFGVLCIVPQFLPASDFRTTLGGISTLVMFAVALLHCYERYGYKNSVVFLAVTWIVSNGLEALSIQTGFPFGHYYYTISSSRILNVPMIIMPAYFGMGYMAWTLAHVLIGQYGKRLRGIHIFLAPLIASFIMVMWDVVMDPIESTLNKSWIWKNGGNYFGVPISNYLGWFFVVFVFLQIFAIYISRFDTVKVEVKKGRFFWLEASAAYGIQCVSLLLTSLTASGNREIYSSTGLVNVFTMLFVTILSVITIFNNRAASPADRETDSVQHKTPDAEKQLI